MELIDNKYRVLRTLGKGGCGVVYVCWSEALNKEVAVKVLHDQMHSNVNLARFRNEAHSLSLCKHPGIVQCLNFGLSPEGTPYFVMDYVPGVSLSEELKQNGPLSPLRFNNIFTQVLSALDCAHQAGLVHRDIKPSNILITEIAEKEHAVLIDFGLTKQLEGQKLTATSALLGTPQYMSPEQCQGLSVDVRSDLYSLGCTMYEAATGRPLYNGEALEIMLSHVQSEPQDIPTALAPLLDRLLDKDRTKRFDNASEASVCLDGLNLGPVTKFETVRQGRAKSPIGSAKRPKLLLALALCAILCMGAYFAVRVTQATTVVPDRGRPANRFKQADQFFDQPDNRGSANAHALLESATLKLGAGNHQKKTLEEAEAACKLFESAKRTRKENWGLEYQANTLVILNSNDKVQLKLTSERLVRASKNEQLAPDDRAKALATAGLALYEAGDKATALALMRTAKDIGMAQGKPPHAGANFAIHTMLAKQLLSDPKEQVALARLVYDECEPIQQQQPASFAVSASYLGSALEACNQYQQAKKCHQESADKAEKLADACRVNDPKTAEDYYGLSINENIQIARCSLLLGEFSAAKSAQVQCHDLLKKTTSKNQTAYRPLVEQLGKQLAGQSPHFAK